MKMPRVSLGGDSDTLACITGGIAEAFHGPVAAHIRDRVRKACRRTFGRSPANSGIATDPTAPLQ